MCPIGHMQTRTIGERIRQAREARRMSGEALALAVGYKNQSAIGNLENRKDAGGGRKLIKIAEVLQVPVEWLLRGPDTEEVPLRQNAATDSSPRLTPIHASAVVWPFVNITPAQYAQLDPRERGQVEGYVQALLSQAQQRYQVA